MSLLQSLKARDRVFDFMATEASPVDVRHGPILYMEDVTVSFDAPARLSVRTANPTDDSQLVFTPANWNTNQTVEVLASINGTEEGTVTQTLTARSSSSDASFDNLSDSISVAISDPTERSGGGGSGALGGGLLIVLGGLAALRRRRLTH